MLRNSRQSTEVVAVAEAVVEVEGEADQPGDAVAAVRALDWDVLAAREGDLAVAALMIDLLELAGAEEREEEETKENQDGQLTCSGPPERGEMLWWIILTGLLLKLPSGSVKNGNKLMLMRKMNCRKKLRK